MEEDTGGPKRGEVWTDEDRSYSLRPIHFHPLYKPARDLKNETNDKKKTQKKRKKTRKKKAWKKNQKNKTEEQKQLQH